MPALVGLTFRKDNEGKWGLPLLSGRFSSALCSVAELAQLVEQRFRKAWVVGSNPMLGSTLKPGIQAFSLGAGFPFCAAGNAGDGADDRLWRILILRVLQIFEETGWRRRRHERNEHRRFGFSGQRGTGKSLELRSIMESDSGSVASGPPVSPPAANCRGGDAVRAHGDDAGVGV